MKVRGFAVALLAATTVAAPAVAHHASMFVA
jgi:hypothetical protein